MWAPWGIHLRIKQSNLKNVPWFILSQITHRLLCQWGQPAAHWSLSNRFCSGPPAIPAAQHRLSSSSVHSQRCSTRVYTDFTDSAVPSLEAWEEGSVLAYKKKHVLQNIGFRSKAVHSMKAKFCRQKSLQPFSEFFMLTLALLNNKYSAQPKMFGSSLCLHSYINFGYWEGSFKIKIWIEAEYYRTKPYSTFL